MAVLWYWLPVRLDAVSPYMDVTLSDGFRLRAWAGTVANLWGLSGLPGADRPMLALNLLAWWVWLLCCLWLLARNLVGSDSYRWFVLVFWAVMLGFTATSFNAYLSFFIDTVAAAWIALTVVACARYLTQPKWTMRVLMVVAPIMAILTHESALVLWAVVVLWCIWKVGVLEAMAWFSPCAVVVAGLLVFSPAPEKLSHGLAIGEYIHIGMDQTWSMLGQSANLFGILSGPGGLWIVFVFLGWVWIVAPGEQARWGRITILFLMLIVSLSPLLVAHDTNRLTSMLWLPVVLLVNEVNEVVRGGARVLLNGKILMFFLAVLQLFNPPSLIYRNGIVPYNCYAWWLSHDLKDARIALDVKPWQLQVYGDNYLTQQSAAQCSL